MKFIRLKNFYYSLFHNSKTLPFNLSNDILDNLDLSKFESDLAPFVKQFFYLNSGVEHYRLLAQISTYYNNETLLDIGTYKGGSALALSFNKNNSVISIDIENHLELNINRTNIEFKLLNILEHPNLIQKSKLIILDTAHDGTFEKELYLYLIESNWDGIIIADDIYLNKPMRKWWKSIENKYKYDITKFGHHSGTGLINLSENSIGCPTYEKGWHSLSNIVLKYFTNLHI